MLIKEKSISDLRGVLFDEIDQVRLGGSAPDRVAAVVSLSNAIMNSAKLEMEYQKMIFAMGQQDAMLGMGEMPLLVGVRDATDSE